MRRSAHSEAFGGIGIAACRLRVVAGQLLDVFTEDIIVPLGFHVQSLEILRVIQLPLLETTCRGQRVRNGASIAKVGSGTAGTVFRMSPTADCSQLLGAHQEVMDSTSCMNTETGRLLKSEAY